MPHIATIRARKGSKRLRLATGRLPENLAPLVPWSCLARRSSVDHEHAQGDRHPHHQQPYRQVGHPLGPVDRPARAEPPEGRQRTPREGHQWVPVYHGGYGRPQPQDGCYPDEGVEALGLGRRTGSAYHLVLTPSRVVAWLGAPSIPPRGVWGLLDHGCFWASPRRAWKGFSRNFALTEFSEARTTSIQRLWASVDE